MMTKPSFQSSSENFHYKPSYRIFRKSSSLFAEIQKNHKVTSILSNSKEKSVELPTVMNTSNLEKSQTSISQNLVKEKKPDHMPFSFDVNDVPLPDMSPLKDKHRKSRKRKGDDMQLLTDYGVKESKRQPLIMPAKDLPLPRINVINTQQETPRKSKIVTPVTPTPVPVKKSVELKKPKLCATRNKSKKGSTWGERSVNCFKKLAEIGEGTYGQVFKAEDRVTKQIKALKRVRLEHEKEGFPITTVREIKILQQLRHHNIIQLSEVVTDHEGFYLVFEYMEYDLYGLIDSGIVLSEHQIASIMKQILEGVNYCHNKLFLHRDLKCSNILMNMKGEVKLADFGLARLYESENKERPYTNRVITLWYRAPELLLGQECYGPPIDIWSVGCIMGELFTHRTLFMANNEIDQLEVIARLCGTPSVLEWPDVAKLPLFKTYRPKITNRRHVREYFCTLSEDALNLLDCMIQLDPKRRLSAQQALNSPWLCDFDLKNVPVIQLPKDRDFHELSCKRRHREQNNEADKSYKQCSKQVRSISTNNSDDSQRSGYTTTQSIQSNYSKVSQVKQQQSNTVSLTENSNIITNKKFDITDNLLNIFQDKLQSFRNMDSFKSLLNQSNGLSQTVIEKKLQDLLEPYIKELMPSTSVDSRGSEIIGSGQSSYSSNMTDRDDPTLTNLSIRSSLSSSHISPSLITKRKL